jgi:phosphate-selective porin
MRVSRYDSLVTTVALTVCVPLTTGAQPAASTLAGSQQAGAQVATTAEPQDTDYDQPVRAAPAAIPATAFVFPDVPDGWNQHTSYEGRLFSTRFSMVPLVDYNAFVQDNDSEMQVGTQESEWDLRTLRLMFRGQLKFAHPVDYLISVEVKGQDHVQTGSSQYGFTDFEFSTSFGALGRLRFGKIKEPFVYEMVGDAANLQQQERALSPFFASRGVGLRIGRPFADNRLSWSFGWYNDWWIEDQTFKASGNDFAARLTAVPYLTDDGANYIHLGVAGRYIEEDEGLLRFRGRPESNVTAYYVDSNDIPAHHAEELGLEWVWGRGPWLVSAEYARAWVDSAERAHPAFWGTYLVVSYVLTGEHRPYDTTVAYARRVMPRRIWGAWEIVGRYSHVDVTDGPIDGGIFDRETIGLNWWATRRWKIGVDYGYITLDRFNLTGRTDAVHMRMQWVY